MIPIGMDIIGRWIRDARVRAGYSQSQLARMTGVHQSTISRLERARLEGLSLHLLALLVAALELSLTDLPVRR
jgi:transcriptional regulator with XRE-family HTH domain